MSMFSIPVHLMPDVKQLEEMNRDVNALLPKELASAVNLMAHPAAGIVAASALGLGLASHAFGVWMGAVAGAAEVSQRLLADRRDAAAPDTAWAGSEAPARRAAATVSMLAAEAQATAKAAVKPATKHARAAAEESSEQADSAATALMPEDFRPPSAMDRPAEPDDLKKISGIGPKLETVLNGLGVWTFAQIAAWQPAELAWVDDYLSFKGRIGRDGWIEQAKTLAASGTKH